jgi:hypothetical protein
MPPNGFEAISASASHLLKGSVVCGGHQPRQSFLLNFGGEGDVVLLEAIVDLVI